MDDARAPADGAEGERASTRSSTRPRSASAATSRASPRWPPRIDLKIIVATGLYTFNELPHYWGRRVPGSGPNGSDPMVDLFVRDITEGIAGTGIKAGGHQVRHRPARA